MGTTSYNPVGSSWSYFMDVNTKCMLFGVCLEAASGVGS